MGYVYPAGGFLAFIIPVFTCTEKDPLNDLEDTAFDENDRVGTGVKDIYELMSKAKKEGKSGHENDLELTATAKQKQAACQNGIGTFAPVEARALWDQDDAPQRDQEMITIYKDAIISATQHAPRFKVLPGEALLMDNHRVMHVREGYADLDRRSWRVFMWAEGDCYGVPQELLTKT